MKRLLTLSTFLLLSVMTFAETVFNGIIYYEISGTKAIVTFGAKKYIGSVTIPASVTYGGQTYSVASIGNRAFYGCKDLTSVTIPNSVTSIGDDAFQDCKGLTSVTIPNSVTSIGGFAFSNCQGLTSVTIGNSVTSIGDGAFSYCYGLTSVTIPNSVTSIGDAVFQHCSGLTSIKVQEENTKYDSRNNCNAIIETASNTLIIGRKNTIIPNGVTSIGESAFSYCSGLTSVTIPNSVTSIGDYSFWGCKDLTSVTIPNSVTSIGSSAFSGTAWYNNQPDGLIYAGKVAYEYKGTMPTNTSITIKDGTLGVADYAFSYCSGLTAVTIPNSVTSIGESAFSYCSGLTSVYSYIEEPTSDTGSNFINYTIATLYVPKGTKDKYLATDGWKKFTNIVEMGGTAVKEISASNINEAKSFSIDGKRLSQPQKGLNILKMSDGTTRKVVK